MPSPDIAALSQRYSKLLLQYSSLEGQAKILRERQRALVSGISLAKARVELAPAATEVFDLLQERAHRRAVGVFEELLSAFMADVFPESSATVELDLGTERGAPALDIRLNNAGNIEDILEGNGGALTNVVSAGLVYAALSRTSARPLVVLDEPDCWLKPERVPYFTRVIAEVSVKAGCQTLLISHHEASLMDPDIHLVELREQDGQPVATPVGATVAWLDDATPGLRWIELENVRRHVLTRIPLAPGANALIGDNNLGKSTAFSTALRAMAYGEMSDTLIRHGAEFAAIRIGLENQVVLELERRRAPTGGGPKLLYRRYEAGVLTNEAAPRTRGSVPDFVTATLQVDYVDGLDIQVRSQKQPIFLLNETPSRRAQLLSVGRESGLLQAVIEKHRLTLKRDREQIRRDEAELNQVNRKLDALAPLTGMTTLVALIAELQKDAQVSAAGLEKIKSLSASVAGLQARLDLLLPVTQGVVPGLPEFTDIQTLRLLVQRFTQCTALAGLPDLPALPPLPVFTENQALAVLAEGMARNMALCALHERMAQRDLPVAPELLDRDVLVQRGKRVRELDEAQEKLQKEATEAGKAEHAAGQAVHALMDRLGVCPLCESSFKQKLEIREEAHA